MPTAATWTSCQIVSMLLVQQHTYVTVCSFRKSSDQKCLSTRRLSLSGRLSCTGSVLMLWGSTMSIVSPAISQIKYSIRSRHIRLVTQADCWAHELHLGQQRWAIGQIPCDARLLLAPPAKCNLLLSPRSSAHRHCSYAVCLPVYAILIRNIIRCVHNADNSAMPQAQS